MHLHIGTNIRKLFELLDKVCTYFIPWLMTSKGFIPACTYTRESPWLVLTASSPENSESTFSMFSLQHFSLKVYELCMSNRYLFGSTFKISHSLICGYAVSNVNLSNLENSPLSRQISSSFLSLPWRTARNWPSRSGRKTV